ncbi:hypothetical protein ACWKSP_34295 [Micromonosporaceae bacterium Da 78-11]
MGDGVYYSAETDRKQRRGSQRRKKALVAVVGLAALLGGGSYGVTTWLNARGDVTDLGAIGPVTARSSAVGKPSATRSKSAKPAPGPAPATKSAVRQSSRPSPTPVPLSTLSDDEIAAVQVNRLLESSPTASGVAAAAAVAPVTVAKEQAADGSTIRVVTARHDLTGQWELLWAADMGRSVGMSRCTQNFRINGSTVAQVRPGMLLCWRTSQVKSVVTVATVPRGRPVASTSVAVINREWAELG